jgi:quercetin dioxygenase-like cupin family protein
MKDADVHVAPDEGVLFDLGGLGVHFKVRGEQTGGSFAIVEHPSEPGVLVDPHTHRYEDELSFVLDGTIWARVGDCEVEASVGSYVGSLAASFIASGTLARSRRAFLRSSRLLG